MPLANTRDLTDVRWKMMDELIPEPMRPRDGRGRPWKDRRAVLNGILWVLRTGVFGLVPLDIMLAHAFLRILALPKTSSASLSQCATAGWSAYSPESCRNWIISAGGGLEDESGAAVPVCQKTLTELGAQKWYLGTVPGQVPKRVDTPLSRLAPSK